MGKQAKVTARSTSMTKTAASRIQGATARANNGSTPKGSFGARAQSAAAKNGK